MDALLDELVRKERSALDRWIRLDPDGYLGIYAENVVYFDPTTERRVIGLDAMRERLASMRNVKLPFTNVRYLRALQILRGQLEDRPQSLVLHEAGVEVTLTFAF
jgi:hypothetical protein